MLVRSVSLTYQLQTKFWLPASIFHTLEVKDVRQMFHYCDWDCIRRHNLQHTGRRLGVGWANESDGKGGVRFRYEIRLLTFFKSVILSITTKSTDVELHGDCNNGRRAERRHRCQCQNNHIWQFGRLGQASVGTEVARFVRTRPDGRFRTELPRHGRTRTNQTRTWQ